jgi:hypothetical protein
MSQAIQSGLVISSAILGGPAGTALHLSSTDGKVLAQLVQPGQDRPQTLTLSQDGRFGDVKTTLPDGRSLALNQYSSGMHLYIESPDEHRVDIGFDKGGKVNSVGSFSEAPAGNEGVRLEGDEMRIIRNLPNSVSENASSQGLDASQIFHHDYGMSSMRLPQPELEGLAEARDRVLNRLADDGFNFGPGA